MSWLRRWKDRINDELEDLVEDDNDDILDESDRQFLRRIFGDMSKASVVKQVAIGSLVGGCSGVLCRKVGRVAALAVGGSLIVVQIAHHQQWITVNWGRVDRRIYTARRKLRRAERNWDKFTNSVELFIRENMFIATGFLGGFLIGLAA